MDPDNQISPPRRSAPEPAELRFLKWAFLGSDGLRSGWSVALFITLFFMFSIPVFALLPRPAGSPTDFTPLIAFYNESVQLLPMLAAFGVMMLIEQRRWTAYHLAGKKRVANFLWGFAGGFLALSALIAVLYFGHWVSFGPVGLSGVAVLWYSVLWALIFLMTGLYEEGAFRCYLLFTFTRSFGASGRGFWISAVLTSALFGLIHYNNSGESQIGILSAAAIGFVLCASVRLTGSAWWAIGFHASWDWGETFFYGAADSGIVPQNHLLTASPVGNPLWSGGATGPEGSLLVLPTVLLVLAVLLAVYGRRGKDSVALTLSDQVSG